MIAVNASQRPALAPPNPRTGLNFLVMLAFVVFCLLKSIFLLVKFAGSDAAATVWDIHLLSFQAVANIAFSVGAAVAVAALRTEDPARSWRLTVWAIAGAVAGFALLFIENSTSPPLQSVTEEGQQ